MKGVSNIEMPSPQKENTTNKQSPQLDKYTKYQLDNTIINT